MISNDYDDGRSIWHLTMTEHSLLYVSELSIQRGNSQDEFLELHSHSFHTQHNIYSKRQFIA